MVFFVRGTPNPPSLLESLMTGLGTGIAQSSQAALQQKLDEDSLKRKLGLQQQYEESSMSKERARLTPAAFDIARKMYPNMPEESLIKISSSIPEVLIQTHQKQLQQQGNIESLRSLLGESVPQEMQPVSKEIPSSVEKSIMDLRNPKYSLEQIATAGSINPAIAKAMEFEENKRQQNYNRLAEHHSKISDKTLEELDKISSGLTTKDMAIQSLENAVNSNNLGSFSWDYMAELTGVEALRSPEGAEFKTALKENIIGNLGRLGAKSQNLWIEKQISDMAPKIGRSKEANLVVTEILKSENNISRKKVEIGQKLANEYETKYGFVPRTLNSDILKELTPYVEQEQKALRSRIEEIKSGKSKKSIETKEQPKSESLVIVVSPDGKRFSLPQSKVQDALKEGWKLGK